MLNQSSADEITKLHRLLKDDIISQQEFETMKRKIIEESAQPYRVQARSAPMYNNGTTTRAGGMGSSGAASDRQRTGGGWLKHLFTAHGRIGRKEYVLNLIVTSVISAIGWSLIDTTAPSAGEETGSGAGLTLLALVLVLPSIWISICAAVKRYHDLSTSGLWLVLLIVPFVGFVVLMVLIFREGTDGANMYGTRPGHTDPTMYTPPDPAREALPNRRDIVSW